MDRTSYQESPGRSPHITHSINSPVQSVHPEWMMESLHSQIDIGHRTNYFEDSSSDGDPMDQQETHRVDDEGIAMATDGAKRIASRNRRSGNYLGGTTEQFHSQCEPSAVDNYLCNTPPEAYGTQPHDHDSPESSFVGSVEELHTPLHDDARKNHISRLHISKNGMHHQRSRSSTTIEQEVESPILGQPSTKADQILGAHRLTLAALQGLKDDAQASPILMTQRESRILGADATRPRCRSSSAPAKKVSLMPPPIDTSRHPLPEDPTRTPYPFLHLYRKHFGQRQNGNGSTTPLSAPLSTADSIMILSIARSNPNSRTRISTLTIPANSDSIRAALRSNNPSAKEKHFSSLDFDDMEFFRQLNIQYRKLLGPYRYLAARSLRQIVVTGTASKAADAGYGWLHAGPRSPRLLASKGLSDIFSEEKLMRHFRRPRLGKARYAWVSWGHRLAAAPDASSASRFSSPPLTGVPGSVKGFIGDTPVSAVSYGAGAGGGRVGTSTSMIKRADNHEGLEFVVSWSAKRLVSVLMAVILLSLAAALLWIFLGPDSSSGSILRMGPVESGSVSEGGGYRHAGDRVGTGAVIGICVLLMGLTGMGGWIGVSWLVL